MAEGRGCAVLVYGIPLRLRALLSSPLVLVHTLPYPPRKCCQSYPPKCSNEPQIESLSVELFVCARRS
eukprot:scaffold1411_cov221-Alexandrium_tamarense.AAC.21